MAPWTVCHHDAPLAIPWVSNALTDQIGGPEDALPLDKYQRAYMSGETQT